MRWDEISVNYMSAYANKLQDFKKTERERETEELANDSNVKNRHFINSSMKMNP